MSRELRICPWVGGRKCGAFLSSLDRDPHPTCARCRGKICTHDMTCDFCVGWSSAQWELFAKKRPYKKWKRSRPSGSVPPAPEAMPRAGTSSEVPQPETSSSSFSCPSGGQNKSGGGGSQGAPGVVSREASSTPARPRSSETGGGGGVVSGHSSVAHERAAVSSAPSGAGEGEVARSQQTPPARTASSVTSPRSSQHARRHDESGEVSEDRSIARSSSAFRSSDRGARKDRRARSRSDSSRDRGRRSRSHSSYRLRSRVSQRRSSSRSLSSRERSRSLDRSRSRRVRSCSRGDRSRSLDRYRSRSSDRYQSRRQRARSPARCGARGHTISLVILVDDFLPPLTVRGQRRKDGKPDESSRRVWRR